MMSVPYERSYACLVSKHNSIPIFMNDDKLTEIPKAVGRCVWPIDSHDIKLVGTVAPTGQ